MAKRKVLVTGATGYIASLLLPAFRERYDLTLIDVKTQDREGREVPAVQVADLLEGWEATRPLFGGVQTVVHLAYYRPQGRGVSGAGKGYYDERPNVDMAHHVLQLSLDEGVERVVVASSNHAADWYEPLLRERRLEMIYPETYPASDNYYGWAKIAYEALGFVFASGGAGPRRLGNAHIRIGAPRELQRGRPDVVGGGLQRYLACYISQRDLQQLFCKSIEAPSIDNEWGIPFQIFYGISGNARAFWSIANARKVIDYQPEDDSEVKYHEEVRRVLVEGS